MSTPNGYDELWVQAINQVLEDRDSSVRIDDIDDVTWDKYIGPMIDDIEDTYGSDEEEEDDEGLA